MAYLTSPTHDMPKDATHLTFGTVYYAPGADGNEMSNYLIQCLDVILCHHLHSAIMLCGDFSTLKNNHLKSSHNLMPIFETPTRDSSALDRIYPNLRALYEKPTVHPTIGLSDHKVVITKLDLHPDYSRPVVQSVQRRLINGNSKISFGRPILATK